jgi:hypothetical protein
MERAVGASGGRVGERMVECHTCKTRVSMSEWMSTWLFGCRWMDG